ncbi:MAG TPA: BMP family ABC transporter substrate-binding protein [Pseudoflavonifractor sp.]|nr:BMP family ABC transporter substrate-binding protein [Pseudoflavonifractor sp.]
MKAKKVLALALSAVMTLSLLAGCGGTPAGSTAPSGTPTPSQSAGTPAPSGAAYTPKNGTTLKVALLVPGLLGDKSFFDATNSAMDLIKSELGAEVKTVEMGTDQAKWYPTFLDYCEDGSYDLILTVSDAVNDTLLQAAGEFPEQKFINVDATMTDLPDNVYAMLAKMGEMSFLAGLVAGKKAEELGVNQIGFIGGLDIPGINEFLIGYIDGAQHVNPDIKVAYSYVGSFTDPSKAKENALIMYQDTSIIYTAAGASGLGVFDAAKQFVAKGDARFAIGVDSDQAEGLKASDPDAANLIITSAIKNIPQYTAEAVKRFTEGSIPWGTDEMMGLKENGVTIAKNEFYEKLLSAESRSYVDAEWEKVVSGAITPIDTVGMSTDRVEEIRQAAKP